MLKKLKDLFNVLKLGEQVANPEFWKGVQSKGQPALAALMVAIVGLLKGTKYEVPIDNDTALLIAGGIFAAVNWVLTLATSKTVGLSNKPIQADVPEVQPALAPVEDHSYQDVPSVSSTSITEGLAALNKDRGRAS